MPQKWTYINPRLYNVNTSASWTYGRKTSAVPCLEYKANAAADTNVIIQIPLPIDGEEGGNGEYLKAVHLLHFVSATSAGVTPLISAKPVAYEFLWAGGDVAKGGMAATTLCVGMGYPNTNSSAGFHDTIFASATAWTPANLSAGGVAIGSLWTSSQMEKLTNIVKPADTGGKTRNYVPRLAKLTHCLELSCSLGASAVWEHYGAICEWGD